MIKKEFAFSVLLSICFSFSLQGQTVWTRNDSLKLKKLLNGETEILISPAVKQEIDLLFSAPIHVHNNLILPIEEILPRPTNPMKEYQVSEFQLNNTHMYYRSTFLNRYFLNCKRFSISTTSEYKRTKIFLEQKTDLKFDITEKLGYHIYGGYSLSRSKSAILPGAVNPLYIGSGFSYKINQRVQIKAGINKQFNVIKKHWEWLWETSVGVSF